MYSDCLSETVSGEIKNPDDGVVVIETNIDDMNPQVYEYVMDRLFKKAHSMSSSPRSS